MQKEKTLHLQKNHLPKMLGELMHSNQFLKVFSISALVLVFFAFGVILVMANKDPLVITLDPSGQILERTTIPKVEDQIREGIKHYLENRYQWEPHDVVKKLKDSESFISPQALKAFQIAVTNVSKFSVERIVSQRIFPNKIEVDLKKSTVLITGDRVTSIQGLKAAGNLKLELTYESGPRTNKNPWGVYISKEKEE